MDTKLSNSLIVLLFIINILYLIFVYHTATFIQLFAPTMILVFVARIIDKSKDKI